MAQKTIPTISRISLLKKQKQNTINYEKLFNHIIKTKCNDIQLKKLIGYVNANDFKLGHIGKLILFEDIFIEDTPFYRLFNYLSPRRIRDEGQFYHFFKDPKWVFDGLLKKGIVQATALSSLTENDRMEYSEFYKRISSNYIYRKNFKEDKNNRYVFCLTKNWRKNRFWEEYADFHKGVCVGFQFSINRGSSEFKKSGLQGIHFRDVFYDSGDDLEFLNELNYEFNKKYGKILLLNGASTFANFYKRNKYSWEDETRLLIDRNVIKNKYFSNSLNKIGDVKHRNDRDYLNLVVDNCLFKLKISEIIIGKESSINISKLMAKRPNLKDIKIWKNVI